MTEDDTFRILCRISLSEMQGILKIWGSNYEDLRSIEEVLSDHYWTAGEYNSYFNNMMYHIPDLNE